MQRLTILIVLALLWGGGCERSSPPSPSNPVQNIAPPPTHFPPQPDGLPEPVDPSGAEAADDGLSPADTPVHFQEVTRTCGVDFSFSSGRSAGEFAIIESLGGGVGIFDYDRDGRADLMFAGGGTLDNRTTGGKPCGLFRNQGDMHFVPVTTVANAEASQFFSQAISAADFDGDGFQDVAVSGYGGVQLLRNQGDGTFTPYSPLVSNDEQAWSTSLAWGDLDNNGHLDLYVTHYVDWSWSKHPLCVGQGDVKREVCPPQEFAGVSDVIYFNNGQGFQRESQGAGLVSGGKGLGVAIADLNNDNSPDIYVANDTVDNFMYLNDGTGKFAESAVLAGVSGNDVGVSTGSMGVCILDANGDQRPDVLVTNFERELYALYRNDSGGFFANTSRMSGFAAFPPAYVGFGTVALDFDFDGDQDLVVANGHVWYASPHSPFLQKSLVFENRDGSFQRLPEVDYFAVQHTGRGLASGDLNNDGAADLVFSNLEEPVAVVQAAAPLENLWATVRLVGTRSNRDAVGASVVYQSAQETAQMRVVLGGGSYLSHSDQRSLFYWSNSATDGTQEKSVVVRWPNGTAEEFKLQAATENILVEGSGTH